MKRHFYLSILLLLFAGLHAQTVSTYPTGSASISDDMILDEAGNMYGSDFSNGAIYKVTPAGLDSVYASGFQSCNGLAWDGQGNLAFCDFLGNRVYKIAPDRSVSVFVDNFLRPSGLIKDPNSDTLYVTQFGTDKIWKLAPDTSLTLFTEDPLLDGPVGMAFDDSLNFLVGNFNNRRVYRIDPDGSAHSRGVIPGSSSLGFIEWNNGYIYGTSFGSHKIYRIDTANQFELVAGSTPGYQDGPALLAQFRSPNGIINSLGGDSLFISEFNNQSQGRVRVLTGLDSIGLVGREPVDVWIGSSLRVLQPRFIEELHCLVQLDKSSAVELELVDLQGRIAWRTELSTQTKGEHLIKVPVGGLSKGVYLVRVEIESKTMSEKILLR